MSNIFQNLTSNFPHLEFKREVELAPLTQVKLGGPAEIFFDPNSIEDFIQVVKYCQANQILFTILGWGANTLIADRGIRGLVIRNRTKTIQNRPFLPSSVLKTNFISDKNQSTDVRFTQISEAQSFSHLDYSETDLPTSTIMVDSGTPLPWLINYTLDNNLTGLQWFARIPATMGGAVVNNIHGGKHFLEENILAVEIIDENGHLRFLNPDELQFGYDTSIFHSKPWIITRVVMKLYKGDTKKAKQVVLEWSSQKKHQPPRSLGCIFQNLDIQTQRKLNLPTSSVGYFIDQILNFKGKRVGHAVISQAHAAFIISEIGCTATDYLALIRDCISEAKKHDVVLKPEIFFKGFTSNELSDIIGDS